MPLQESAKEQVDFALYGFKYVPLKHRPGVMKNLDEVQIESKPTKYQKMVREASWEKNVPKLVIKFFAPHCILELKISGLKITPWGS